MLFDLFIKKIGQWKFLASANSRKIQCEHHLVAVLFVCGKSVIMALVVSAYLKPPQPRRVGEAGKKTPIFPAGKVAIWIAKQAKFMAALRWFLPRENSGL